MGRGKGKGGSLITELYALTLSLCSLMSCTASLFSQMDTSWVGFLLSPIGAHHHPTPCNPPSVNCVNYPLSGVVSLHVFVES